MIEVLAIPGWQAPPTALEAWVAALEAGAGSAVTVRRESAEGTWVELETPRLRGYALIAGPHVEAINFELDDPDPAPAARLLETAAATIGWEIHPDDPDDDDDDE